MEWYALYLVSLSSPELSFSTKKSSVTQASDQLVLVDYVYVIWFVKTEPGLRAQPPDTKTLVSKWLDNALEACYKP